MGVQLVHYVKGSDLKFQVNWTEIEQDTALRNLTQ